MKNLRMAGDAVAVSHLTRLECRVGPIKRGDLPILAKFDQFFSFPTVQIVPMTPQVFDRATLIRATYGFRTADAIHLAAALENGCRLFLTHDARLSRFPEIAMELLS